MTASIHRIVNLETNEVTEIEFTDEELKFYEDAKIAEQEKIEAKTTQRQAILDRLGLTAEEAALLLGGN